MTQTWTSENGRSLNKPFSWVGSIFSCIRTINASAHCSESQENDEPAQRQEID